VLDRLPCQQSREVTNHGLQETAIALITTSKAAQSLGLHDITELYGNTGAVWVILEILNHRNDKSELSSAAGPVGCSGFGLMLGDLARERVLNTSSTV
jgi:hypothetical protein